MLLETVIDGYDQLISEAETEVDELRQGHVSGDTGMSRPGGPAAAFLAGVLVLTAISVAVVLVPRGRRWL